jgi:hypothetical protein
MLVVVCCDCCTPNIVTRDTNDVCQTAVSDADGITVMSSSQNEEIHISYSTPTSKDPPESRAKLLQS